MRVLFTTQVGSGHWRPLAPFARALAEEGHMVAFASRPIFCSIIAEHGFRGFPIGRDDWLAQSQQPAQRAGPEQSDAVLFDQFIPRAARDLPALLGLVRDWRPDVLVRETTEFAACVAAECMGLPHAAVQISAFRPHTHKLLVPSLDGLRALIGLAPDPALAMLYRYLLLMPFPPRYQDPAVPLPPTTHAVRHVSFDIGRPGDERLPDWTKEMARRPTVYATLGTSYNRTPGIFDAILTGLRDEPITLIMTLGPGYNPGDFGAQPPPHIHIERYIPQSLLFPHCDLVITHGGSGTVRTAIDHGLPMVIIPIAADQPENAARCAALGLARVVRPDQRTPEVIREAVRAVLNDPRYRQAAERLREEIHALPGLDYAVHLLERLAVERQPLIPVSWSGSQLPFPGGGGLSPNTVQWADHGVVRVNPVGHDFPGGSREIVPNWAALG
jgi:UDP:flavonoid glycosyltransferase YjiC (YdhE family)